MKLLAKKKKKEEEKCTSMWKLYSKTTFGSNSKSQGNF